MSANVNVNLSFTANTSQAKAQLENLQTSLKNITNTTSLGGTGKLGITKQLQEGITAAAELQIHLKKATNINTGNLDFSKLNQSLKQSGMTLQQYGAKLQQLGPQGQQAFQQLANSVAQSEIPIKRSNAHLEKFATTLKNTVRWQISASLLQGFTSTIQNAYRYAQDLNESLNNIRIVTGYNTDEMAKFAEEANRAAKRLSTTTTAYAEASLIFYQQGLKGDDVAKRADIVTKMANVTKENAEDVSSYMTAIWNNFDDGSQSLEYFGDVLTKLGAATASSTKEIAGGLEKFAAIGDTVGLSYEYATSALATIVAKTRQSEDVVGTALKTIFGRIQGLSLGETLEDGTDLNKYSKALATVGIDIKEANGELKDMDDILDEMGAKWNTISKDRQVALAQAVGGMRQYNQVVSLMDNWDFMKQNLDTAYSATGELEKQADIYAESWDAASKRVKAAAQGIYQSLLDDDFFIDLNNGFAEILETIDHLIDSLGGAKGVLMGLGALLTKVFSTQMSIGLTNMANGLMLMTKKGQEAQQAQRANFISQSAKQMLANNPNDPVAKARAQALTGELELQEAMIANSGKMTELELERNKILMDRSRQLAQEKIQLEENLQVANKNLTIDQAHFKGSVITAHTRTGDNYGQALNAANNIVSNVSSGITTTTNANLFSQNTLNTLTTTGMKDYSIAVQELGTHFKNLQITAEQLDITLNTDLTEDTIKQISSTSDLGSTLRDLNMVIEQVEGGIREYALTVSSAGDVQEENRVSVDNFIRSLREKISTENHAEKSNEEFTKSQKLAKDAINSSVGKTRTWSDNIVGMSQGVMSFSMALSSLSGIINTLKNPDMSGWEKFTSVLMSASMTIPMLISGFGTMKTSLVSMNTAMVASDIMLATSRKKVIEAMTVEQIAQKTGMSIDQAEIALNSLKQQGQLKLLATSTAYNDQQKIEHLMSRTGMSQKQAEIVLSELQSDATMQEALSQAGLTGAKKKGILTSISAALFKKAETLATKADTGAKWANVKATIAQYLANKPLLVVLGALAAIIGVVALAWWGIDAAVESNAEKTERLNKQLDDTSKAYEEATNAVKEFQDLVNNYEEGINGLKKLEEGTEVYKEKLEETNNIAKELLTNYDLWSKVRYNEQGLLVFDEGVLDQVEQQKKDAQRNAQGMKMSAQLAKQTFLDEQAAQKRAQELGFYNKTYYTNFTQDSQNKDTNLINYGKKHYNDVSYNGNGNNAKIQTFQQGDNTASVIREQLTQQQAEVIAKAINKAMTRGGSEGNTTSMALAEELNSLVASGELPDAIAANVEAFMEQANELSDWGAELNESTEALKKFSVELGKYDVKEIYGDQIKAYAGDDEEKLERTSLAISSYLNNYKPKEGTKNLQERIDYELDYTNLNYGQLAERYGKLNPEKYGNLKIENDEDLAKFYFAEQMGISVDDLEKQGYYYKSDNAGNGIILNEAGEEVRKINDNQAQKNLAENLVRREETAKFIEEQGIKDPTQLLKNATAQSEAFKDNYGIDLSAILETAIGNNSFETLDFSAQAAELTSDEREALLSKSDKELKYLLGIDNIQGETFKALQEFGVENAQQLVDAFKNGIENISQEDIDAALEEKFTTAAEQYDLDADVLKTQTKILEQNVEGLEGNTKAAADMAIANQRLNKGVDKLTDGWKDWKKTLKGTDKETSEYAEAVTEVNKSLRDILGLTKDELIPEDFWNTENIDLLDKVADGSEEAVNKLKLNLINAQIDAETLTSDISTRIRSMFNENAKISDDDISKKFEAIKNSAKEAISQMQADFSTLNPGDSLDDPAKQKAWAESLNEYAKAVGMSAEEMESLLSKANVSANVEMIEGNMVTKYIPQVKITRSPPVYDENGYMSQTETSTIIDYDKVEEPTLIPQISYGDGETKKPIFTKSSFGNISPSVTTSGKGGGGKSSSSNKPKDKTKKSDIVERYLEINKVLDKQSDIVSDLSDMVDNLYGQDKLDAMDRYINGLNEENALLDEKLKLNAKYLAEDKQALMKYGVQIDKDGFVTNEEEILENYYNKLSAYEDKANSFATQEQSDEYREKYIEPLEKEIDAFKSAMDSYTSEMEIYTEILNKKLDNLLSITETRIRQSDERVEKILKDNDKRREKLDKNWGAKRITGEQEYRKSTNEDINKINEEIIGLQSDNRYRMDSATKWYGITFNDKNEAENEEDRLDYLEKTYGKDSLEYKSAQNLLEMIGMTQNSIEGKYEQKAELGEAVEDSFWGEFDLTVELTGIVTDLELQKIELSELFLDDDDFSKKMNASLEKAVNVGMPALDNARNTLNNLLNMSDAVKGTTEWWEQWQDALGTYFDAIGEAYEYAQEALQAYMDGIEGVHEKAMESIEDFDTIGENIQHYTQLLELLGRDTDYETLGKYYQAEYDNAEEGLKSLINYRDKVLLPERDKLARDIAAGVYKGEALEEAKEQLDTLNNLVDETGAKINSKIEEIAELANQIFENAMAKAGEAFQKLLTGGSSFDDMMTSIDRLSKSQEEYLTRTNQLYETNKLARQAQLEMDKTDNLMAKQKYQEYIKYIDQLGETNQMSQQDLEIAQARFNLLQAQIALEEAQNAKDSMRLVRNASGNWSYVYTANQDSISKAEDDVANAENNLYNIGLENSQEYRDKMNENLQEYYEKYQEIVEKYKDDDEAREKALAELKEYHLNRHAQLEREYYTAYDTMVAFSANNYADYQLGNIISTEDFEKAQLKLYNDTEVAVNEWKINTERASEDVGDSYYDVERNLGNIYTKQDEVSTQINNELIPSLKNEMIALSQTRDYWLELYGAIEKTIKAEAEWAKTQASQTQTQAQAGANSSSFNNKSTYSVKTDYSEEMINSYLRKDLEGLRLNSMYRDMKINELDLKDVDISTANLFKILEEGLKNPKIAKQIDGLISAKTPLSQWASIIEFDTGGYTGHWGPEGKWAMLHEKELVLNKYDTDNLLKSVELVRQISKYLDNQAMVQMMALLGAGNLSQSIVDRQPLEQEVTIHANFPNVQDHNEIELALADLVNQAAQYANEWQRKG